MNLFKNAFRNIKKSHRDYSVYFFTLIVAVAIFYMFNSLGEQSFLKEITSATSGISGRLSEILEAISVGVAVVFGILMIYAGNFIIKRRKKEFGIYMMLGMSKKKVSLLLVTETLLVGIISLVLGLFIGVFGSELMSIIVGRMFEIDLSSFTFQVSPSAIAKTSINFAVMFLIVLVFNTRSIGKYKLIDLFTASKKAEKKLLGPKLSIALFIVSVAALIAAYIGIGFKGATIEKNTFIALLFTGFVATFTLFISLAGALPYILKNCKSFYLRKLNSFITGQFTANINTSAFSFAVICLLLFLAISAFSVGFSMNSYINRKLGDSTPADISIRTGTDNVSAIMSESGYDLDGLMGEYIEVPVYETPYITIASSVMAAFDKAQETFFGANWDSLDLIMRLSDYNKLERLYGREELVLSDNQYAEICDFDLLAELSNEAISLGNAITVGECELTSGYDACIDEFILMSGMSANMGAIVLPDSVVDAYLDSFTITDYVFAGNYMDSSEETREKTDAVFNEVFGAMSNNDDTPIIMTTKTGIEENNVGTSVSAVFISLYIGIVFIITGAAVIALKILSDSIDSIPKYDILDRVGADIKMRTNALFTQILLNFLLPLIPAILHSFFGLKYASGLLKAFGLEKMINGVGMASIIMILIYGGYFLITYGCCRKIVISN